MIILWWFCKLVVFIIYGDVIGLNVWILILVFFRGVKNVLWSLFELSLLNINLILMLDFVFFIKILWIFVEILFVLKI